MASKAKRIKKETCVISVTRARKLARSIELFKQKDKKLFCAQVILRRLKSSELVNITSKTFSQRGFRKNSVPKALNITSTDGDVLSLIATARKKLRRTCKCIFNFVLSSPESPNPLIQN